MRRIPMYKVHKKREYFVESFFSVANQSYKNIEIIVIYDDDDVNDLKFINDEVLADVECQRKCERENLQEKSSGLL